MNYMKQVAEMLGLEWDDVKQRSEIFKVDNGNNGYFYQFTDMDLGYALTLDNNACWMKCNSDIVKFLNGTYTIQKLPWRPKHREDCWLAKPFDYSEKARFTTYYEDKEYCRHYLKCDLYRKTEQEVIARTDEILRLMGVEQDDSVE